MSAQRSRVKSNRKKVHSTKLFHRRPNFEPLEQRQMLSASNLFAEFIGILNQSGDVEHIPITVAPEKLGVTTNNVLLGLQVHSRNGSSFDPAAVAIRAADGTLVKTEYAAANLADSTDSVVIAGLNKGDYTLEVSGAVTERSQYQVDVYLVGDVDGDHLVGQNDIDAIRQIYGAKVGSNSYQLAADANLDGRINATDLALARRNQVASQRANSLLAQFEGVLAQPGDVGCVSIHVSLSGQTSADGKTFLAFQAKGLGGGDLNPDAITIRSADGTLVTPEYTIANLPGSTDSVVVAGLTAGDYTLEVTGTATTRSHFQVDVFLVGDVDGDHTTGLNDLDAIRQIYGAQTGDANYKLAADANLDGRINATDLMLARRNQLAGAPVVSETESYSVDISALSGCGNSDGLVVEEGWGGVYDRVDAVTPTDGYKSDASMQFFESAVGWVQPLGSATAPQGGVGYVPVDPVVTVDWFYRDADYGDDLVMYRVDRADGAILVNGTYITPGTSGYIEAATDVSRQLARLNGEDSDHQFFPDMAETLPNPHQMSVTVEAGTYYSFYLVQGAYKNTSNPPQYKWFVFSGANVDGYQHYQEVQPSDPLYVAGATTYKVEDLSNNTTLYPNPGGYTNDADFNDVVFSIDIAPQLELSGQNEVAEGLEYTLTLGDVVDPDQGDVVTRYTIHWGDEQTSNYTAAQIAALSRQVTHTYAYGPGSPTITVDLTDNDGTHTSVASKSVVIFSFPALSVYPAAPSTVYPTAPSTFIQSDGNSSLHVEDASGELRVAIGYGDSYVGDDYVITGNLTFHAMTQLGFVARGDMESGHGYVLTLDPTDSSLALTKLISHTASTTLTSHCLSELTVNPDDTFKMALEVNDTAIIGKLYNTDGVLLDTIEATDSSYSTGVVGTWASKRCETIDASWSDMHLIASPPPVSSVDEGSPYTLTLTDPDQDTTWEWTVDWGDGTSDTYTNDGEKTHIYADGPQTCTITATATGVISEPVGELDTTFGSGGTLITPLTEALCDYGHSMVIQPDGKIVVAGNANGDLGLARYCEDGALDQTFGQNGNGRVVTRIYSFLQGDILNYGAEGVSVALDSRGRIIVAAHPFNYPEVPHYDGIDPGACALVRYDANGNLDTSFGDGGKIIDVSFALSEFASHSVAIQSDNKIVVTGTNYDGNNWNFVLARYTVDGNLDTTFGNGGKVSTRFGYGYAGGGNIVAIQPDGKVLVKGRVGNGTGNTLPFLARYTTDGVLDQGFGNGGFIYSDVMCVAVQPDGKIVSAETAVSNENTRDFCLRRYEIDGSLDTNFGAVGGAPLNLDSVMNAAIRADGKIVVIGWTQYDGATRFGLACYNNDGSSDVSFGTNGEIITDFGDTWDMARDVAFQSDGKIVATGGAFSFNGYDNDEYFALARYWPGVPTYTCHEDVAVRNVAPTLTVVGSQTVKEGQILDLPEIGTFTDPGFSNPQDNPATHETFTYSIDWGDGISISDVPVTNIIQGEADVLTQGSFVGTHIYAGSGHYTVTVTVTDDDGGSDTKTVQVTVNTPTPPWFTSIPIVDAYIGTTYQYLATATDDEGDPLTFDEVADHTLPGASFHVGSDGLVTWTPTADLVGQILSVEISVTDGNHNPVVQAYQVYVHADPANQAPVIVSDAVTTYCIPIKSEEHSVDVPLYAVDSPLSIRRVDLSSYHAVTRIYVSTVDDSGVHYDDFSYDNLSGHHVIDFNELAYDTAVTDQYQSQGAVFPGGTIAQDGSDDDWYGDLHVTHSYAPSDGWSALFRVDFTEPVENLQFTTGWVNALPSEQFATITINYLTIPAGSEYTYAIKAIDPDGDLPLYFDWTEGSDNHDAILDNGVMTWSPPEAGSYDFSVTVSDGRGGTDVQAWTIVVDQDTIGMNRAPTISETAPPNAMVQRDWVFQVHATDLDNDRLRYYLIPDPNTEAPAPTGMTIGQDTGFITWAPTPDQEGAHTFWVRAVDGRGGEDVQEFTVTVDPQKPVNRAPVISSSPSLVAYVGVQYTYYVQASDLDGDPLTYELLMGPEGMTSPAADENGNEVVVWTPTDDQIGSQTVLLYVYDSQFLGCPQAFTITVRQENDPPKIVSSPNNAGDDTELVYPLEAIDPNGDVVTFTLKNGPVGMEIESRLIGGVARDCVVWDSPVAGSYYEVAIVAADGRGGQDEQDFTLTVGEYAPPQIEGNIPKYWIVGEAQETQLTVVTTEPITDLDNDVHLDAASIARGLTLTKPSGSNFQVNDHYEYVYTLDWTPQNAGTFSAYITATNSAGAYRRVEFDLEAVPQVSPTVPPEFTSYPVVSATVGSLWSWTMTGNDPDGSNSTLVYSVVDKPADCSFDPQTHALTWTPQAVPTNEEGTGHFEVRLTDETGAYRSLVFDVKVFASAPTGVITLTTMPYGPAIVDQTWTYLVHATDGNGSDEGLTYQLVTEQSPTNMHIETFEDQTLGHCAKITWVPTEPSDPNSAGYHFAVQVSKFGMDTLTSGFYLPVVAAVPPNDPPEFHTKSLGPIVDDCPFKFQLNIDDPNGHDWTVALTDTTAPGFTGANITSDGYINWTPTVDGDFTITLTATDEYNAPTTVTYPIHVFSNAAPVIDRGLAPPAFLGDTYQYAITITDPNPEDTIAVVSLNAEAAAMGLHMVHVPATNIWTLTWDTLDTLETPEDYYAAYPGRSLPDGVPLTIHVEDNHGAYVNLVFPILSVFDPNDPNSPAQNETITIPAGRKYEQQLVVQSAAGRTLTYEWAQPSSLPDGITLTPGGLITWTPTLTQADEGEGGGNEYVIPILVDDGVDTPAAMYLTITVVRPEDFTPIAPVITSLAPTGATAGQQFIYEPTLAESASGLQWYLDVKPDGMTIDSSTGRITWTPTTDLIGKTVDIEIRVADPTGAGDVQPFNLAVGGVDQAPTIDMTFPKSWTAGQPFALDVLAHDPEGQAISYQLLTASGNPLPENSPITMSSEGHISWSNPAAIASPYSYIVRVAEKYHPTSYTDQPLELYVSSISVNCEPIVIGMPNGRYATVGQQFRYQFTADDLDAGNGFTWAIERGVVGNMVIDEDTGLFTWTPATGVTGNKTVTISVTDDPTTGFAATTYLTFTITAIENTPPVITPETTLTPVIGTQFVHQVKAADPEGGSLTFAFDGTVPQGMVIDSNSGVIRWNIPNDLDSQHLNYTVPVVVTNQYGATATQNLAIHVSLTDTVAPTINAHVVDAAGNIVAPGQELDVHGKYYISVDIADNSGTVAIDDPSETVAPQFTYITVLDVAALQSDQFHAVGEKLDYGFNWLDLTGGLNQGNIHFAVTATDTAGNKATCDFTYHVTDTSVSPPARIDRFVEGDNHTLTLDSAITGTVGVWGVANMADPDHEETGHDYYYYQMVLYRADTDYANVTPRIENGNAVYENGSYVFDPGPAADHVVVGEGYANSDDMMLGKIDTTLLDSGMYRLVLAVKCNCTSEHLHYKAIDERIIEIRNEVKPASLELSFTDLNVDLGGIPVSLVRSYSSANVDLGRSDFSPGWSLSFLDAGVHVASFNQATNSLQEPMARGTRVLVTLPDGTVQRFTFDPQQVGGSDQYRPYFRPDTDVTSTLDILGLDSSLLLVQSGQTQGAYEGPYVTANTNQDFIPCLFGSTLVLRTQGGVEYLYDAQSGRLTAVQDDTGRRIDVTQSADGLTTTIAAASSGQSITITRDANGRISQIEDPNSQVIHYDYGTYDPQTGTVSGMVNNLAWVRLRDDSEEHHNRVGYVYDANHHLTNIYDNAGVAVLTAAYDTAGHLTGLTDAGSQHTGLSSRSLGNGKTLVTVTDSQGMVTEEVRDNRGDVLRRIQAIDSTNDSISPTERQYLVTVYVYSMAGWLTDESIPFVVTGEANRLSASATTWSRHLEYDSFGNVKLSRDALGNTTTYKYDDKNRLIETTDPLGNVTHNVYDSYTGSLLETYVTQGSKGTTKYNHTKYEYENGQLTATYQVDEDDNEILVSSSVYDGYGRLASTTDAAGVIVYYAFDDNGNQTHTWHNWADGIRNAVALVAVTTYDANGRATQTDQYELTLGSPTATITTISALETAIGSATAVWTTHTYYDARGQVEETVDQYDAQTWNVYDARGNVIETRTQTKNASGVDGWLISRTLYDTQGRVEFATDSYFVLATAYPTSADVAGLGTRNVYDQLGRVIRTERYDGVTIELVNDATYTGQKTTELPTGFDWETAPTLLSFSETVYDEIGRVKYTVTSNDPGTTADDARTDYYYDATGRQIAVLGPVVVVDGVSQRLLSESIFDAAGRLIQANTDIAITEVTNLHPDITSAAIRNESAMQTTFYEYDPVGRQTAVVSTAVVDPDDPGDTTHLRTETVYDSLGRRVAVRENIKQTSPFSASTIDRSAQVETTYEYNDAGRLTTVVLPAVADPQNNNQLTNPTYTYSYDIYGDQLSATDPLGHETWFTYDAEGHELTRSLPLAFGADGKKNLPTDQPTGFTEQKFYDDLGRLDYEISFEGVYTRYGYDSLGRLHTKEYFEDSTSWDGGNGTADQTTTYTFDAFGRVVVIAEDTNGSPSTIERTTTNTYDSLGQLTAVASPEGTIRYEYDQHTGLMTRTYTGLADDAHTSTTSDGKAITDTRYGYDDLGRLVSVTVVERNDTPITPETTEYRYDLLGNLEKTTLPNDVVSDYQYDQMNRLKALDEFLDSNSNGVFDEGVDTLLAEYDYDLALDGTRTGVTEKTRVSGTLEETRIDWLYDNLGRLTREVYDSYDNALDYTADYVMNLVGNRLSKKTDSQPTTQQLSDYRSGTAMASQNVDEAITSVFDANDRLLKEFKDVAGTENDTTTLYEYGPNADPANGDGGDYTQQTRQTAWQGTDTNPATGTKLSDTSYQYNVQGRMSEANVDSDGDGDVDSTTQYEYADDGTRVSETVDSTKTVFLVDNQNSTGYSQVLEEKNASGTVQKTFTIGLDVIAQQAPSIQSGGTLWLLKDGHNSTRGLVDALGQPLSSEIYRYDGYGAAIGFNPLAALTNRLYNSEPFRGSIGRYDFRARLYDPLTGIFGTRDPARGNINDPLTFHTYLFTPSDPINHNDPTGRFFLDLLTTIGLQTSLTSLAVGGITGAVSRALGASFTSGFLAGSSLTVIALAAPEQFPEVFANGLTNGLVNAVAQAWTDFGERYSKPAFNPSSLLSAFIDGFGWGAASAAISPFHSGGRVAVAAVSAAIKDVAGYMEGKYRTGEDFLKATFFDVVKAVVIQGAVNATINPELIEAFGKMDRFFVEGFVKALMTSPWASTINLLRDWSTGDIKI